MGEEIPRNTEVKQVEKDQEQWEIRLLGVRGSMAVTGSRFQKYGGDTLCVRVQAGETVVFLDAGTGIMHGTAGSDNHVLIGHPHLDHLIGLCKWQEMADPSKKMHLYMAEHEGMNCAEILHILYGPPFWPIPLEAVAKGLEYVTLGGENGNVCGGGFRVGELWVETLQGNHPGGVTHYKLSDGKRTVVYAVDCELTADAAEQLEAFAKGCDLLICDGQLTSEDLKTKRGWGHSSMEEGARLGQRCGAAQTVLVHYDPGADDDRLDKWAEELKKQFPACDLGRQGEVRFL